MADKDKKSTPDDHNDDIDKVLRGEAKPTDPDIDARLPEDPSRALDDVEKADGEK